MRSIYTFVYSDETAAVTKSMVFLGILWPQIVKIKPKLPFKYNERHVLIGSKNYLVYMTHFHGAKQ